MYNDDMVLSPLVEKKLENLYIKFAKPEIDKAARKKLYELGEEKTLSILLRIDQFPEIRSNISAVIEFLTSQKQHDPSPRIAFSSSTTAVLSPSQHASASSSSREMSATNRWDVEIVGITEEDLLAMMNQEGTPVNFHKNLLHEPEYYGTKQQKIVPGAVAVATEKPIAFTPPRFPFKSSQGSNSSGDLLLVSPGPNESCSTPKTPPLPKSASNSRKRTGDGFLGTEDRNVRSKDSSGGRRMIQRKLDMGFFQETTTDPHSSKITMPDGGTSSGMRVERLQEHMNISDESGQALQTPSVSRNSFRSCIQETNAALPVSRFTTPGGDSSGLPAQKLQEQGQPTVSQIGVMNFEPQLQAPEIFNAEHRKVGEKNVQALLSATPHVHSRDPSSITSYPQVPHPVVLQTKMENVFVWPEWTDQLRAFGDLEFTKRFLIHSYASESEAMPPLEELQKLKSLGLEEVDKRLHNRFERPAHHTLKRDWCKVEQRHRVFSCTINSKGNCKFSGPALEIGSTPLQHAFGDENVLRVSFEDTSNDNDVVRLQYHQLAREGILCGLKRFIFYGYKDAQAKKKQGITKNLPYGVKCIFVSIESHAAADLRSPTYRRFETHRDVRNYMMHPTVPFFAKSVARLQLALSATVQIPLDFDKIKVEIIQDVYCMDEEGNIVNDRNGKPLIHTDGIGFVSKNLAMLCQDIIIKGCKQPHLEKQDYPLMMQIRLFCLGNVSKGVLLVNCLLPDDTMQVRESMLKVKRDDSIKSPTFNSLEICNTSRRPGTAKLFQHLILLLKKGGVPDEVFIDFAETALEDIKTCFKSREAAMRVAWDNAKDNNNSEIAYRMLGAGLMPNIEPYLHKILWDMVKGRLQDFSKGKVPVPKSKYLLGCSDPTGLLERNQVAIVLEDGPIYRDKVLVYKPPGLHLGDVHVFEATWHKKIGEYVGKSTYGLFFPAKGARSVPDEMAGSDLDGDQYWICWNDKVVDNFTPSPAWQACLDPTPSPPLRSDDDAEFQTQHFEKFLKARFDPSFIKGQVANNWLALTDCTMQSQEFDENQTSVLRKISELVDLFYKALDADKSGEEVGWIPRLKSRTWPHFMEKNKDEALQRTGKCGAGGLMIQNKKFLEYQSTSIIGKMHDLVKKADFECPANVEFKLDDRFEYEGYIPYFEQWKVLFKRYKGEMNQKLSKSDDYGIRSYQSDDLLAFYTEIFLHGDCAMVAKEMEKDKEKIKKSREQLLAEASAIYTAVYDVEKKKERVEKALQFAWKVAGYHLCELYAASYGAGIPFVMSSDALKEVIGSRR